MIKRKLETILILLLLCIVLLSKILFIKTKALQVEPFQQNFENMRALDVSQERIRELNRGQSARRFTNELTANLLYNSLSYKKEAKEVQDIAFFKKMVGEKTWGEYFNYLATIFIDIKNFPIGNEYKVSYENSWGQARSYGGKRKHEGCDLMPQKAIPGVIPIVSVCDGTVENIGWLTLGGYRVGVRGKHGGYFYYAHLDSYENGVQRGSKVKAGQILGYMGDSGYGEEGTRGEFPVHLHFGIYVDYHGEQISMNPYAALVYLEEARK